MSVSGVRPPPVPSAVAFLHRPRDDVGDGAPNAGGIFLGPANLPPARNTLAWLVGHGYSIRLEYFHDESAARAAYPTISFDVGDRVRDEGAVILAAHPSIVSDALTPQTKTHGAFSPAPRRLASVVHSTPPSAAGAAGGALRDINNINIPLPSATGSTASTIRAPLPGRLHQDTTSPHNDGGAAVAMGVSVEQGGSSRLTPGIRFGPSSSTSVASQQDPAQAAASVGGPTTHLPVDPPASQVDLFSGCGFGGGDSGFYTPSFGGFVPPATSSRFGFQGFVDPLMAPPGSTSLGVPGAVDSSRQFGVGGGYFHPSTPPIFAPSQLHPGGLLVPSPSVPAPCSIPGGVVPSSNETIPHRTRPAMEPDARLADDVVSVSTHVHGGRSTAHPRSTTHTPPSMVSICTSPTGASTGSSLLSNSLSELAPSSGGGDVGGMEVCSPASDTVAGVIASASPPVVTAMTTAVPTDDDPDTIKSIIKAITPFNGGSKAAETWPSFWSKMESILRFSTYAPNGPLVTTPANAANSNRLANLLTVKVGEPASRPFFNNPAYIGKGFERLARLRQTYAPSERGDRFGNIQGLIFLEQGPQDSLEDTVSKIRQFAAMLDSGGWPPDPQLLTNVLMKALDDRYAAIKSDFALNPEVYADMTVDDLEQRIIKWAAAHKILIGPSGASSAAAVRGNKAAPGSSLAAPTPDRPLTTAEIKKRRKNGSCSCGSSDHVLENCPNHKLAGFIIKYDSSAADDPKPDAEGYIPARNRRRGGNKKKTPDSEASPAVAAVASPPPPATAPPSSSTSTMGGAAHASANQFEALESDEESGFDRDVGVSYAAVAAKSNANSFLYPPSCSATSAHIGSASHVAALCDRPASSASHVQHSSLVIADSGATDHMWNDYSAFTSYHPTSSKHVTLADNTQAPVAGIGSIKILLDGKVCGLRNVLHVPSLRVSLYSLRAHRLLDGCGFVGDNSKFHVYFPTFVATVDDSVDSYMDCTSLGRSSSRPYDYLQPRTVYAHGVSTSSPTAPAVVEFSQSEVDVAAADYDVDFPPLSRASSPRPLVSITPPVVPVVPPKPSTAQPSLTTTSTRAPTHVCTPKRISQDALRAFLPTGATAPPPVRPCDTPNGSDTTRHLTADQIYHLFGNRRFRNYQHFCFASKDSKFINGSIPTPTLGEFTSIPKRKRGDPIQRPTRALDKVHLDIVFGDGLGRLGYRYALLFVDRATRYIWVFGLKSLHADAIISAFTQFRADAGRLAAHFRTDCDAKLLSQQVVSWLRENGSDIASSAAGRQSSNGLVERNWRTMVEMARAYLTEKQMPRSFWFYAIQHAARMMNCIPGKINDALTTPFELIHHSPPDSRLWFPLFSLGYFHHTRDGSVARSGFQAQTMEGIAVGRSTTSNAMVFYNPTTKQYYEPDTYKLDPSRLPSTAFPKTIVYDGGIFADLYRDNNPNVPEPFPPGTRVLVCLHGSTAASEGTISSIPLKGETGSTDAETYMVLFDDGSLAPAHLSELRSVTQDPQSATSDTSSSSLPAFLASGTKVILAKDGIFHKGYLIHTVNGTSRFSVRNRLSSKREQWGVDLPSFASEWPILCAENRLIPSWIVPTGTLPPAPDPSYFGGPSASASSTVHIPTTWDVPKTMPTVVSLSIGSASHVSAKGCQQSCPSSLQRALDPSNPDRDVWIQSYAEEKQSLLDVNTFKVISLDEYRRLRQSGAPQAIPSMCVLVIKTDEHGLPDRAKSRIVVLGNLEDRCWGKHERAAPVLKYSSLRLMVSGAIERRRKLKQADYKNAFCNPTLPDDEITIIRPPLGDPDAQPGEYWLLQKTLYGLRRSPKHWYEMASTALLEMGLTQSTHDPCLFYGIPSSPAHPAQPGDEPITVGLYVDDMVYFSDNDDIEHRFEKILASQFKISFLGVVNWFLGTHFTWRDHADGHISVHLSQLAFAQNLVERYRQQHSNINSNATPYRSGLPIDSLEGYSGDMEDPSFLRLRALYQSVVGSLNWLATNTRPDLAPVTSFLAAYNHYPTQQHMDAALYAIKYVRSTVEYGIAFHSNAHIQSSAFVHFPFHHDIEAYNDALPPTAAEHSELTAYSDACWGSQLGNIALTGKEIEMFKLRSMSGYIVLRAGGPIAWASVRQERTSRSSCEAEVRATDECAKEVLSVRLRGKDIGLQDDDLATPIHNDNQGCVDWCKTTTTAGMKHINLRSNAIRESVHLGELSIHHIPGVINCADIFTKELKDCSHFCLLRDSFMMDKSKFDL